MNSTINLKGIGKPLYVSKASAEKIQNIYHDKNIPKEFAIKVGNQSFSKGDIKYIEVNSDGSQSQVNDNEMTNFYKNEMSDRESLVKKSPEYKAGLLDMFFYLYKNATMKEPSQETLDEAKEVQLQFFKENPRRTLCDVYLLKKLIPKVNSYSPNSLWDETEMRLRPAYFKAVEFAVLRDMEMSR
jgi:hypothetical protein